MTDLYSGTGDFQRRFAEALRLRLYPNTNLHLKQLAAGIGRSENTVARWWRGDTRASAEDVDRMARFFSSRGDTEFLRAVFGQVHRAGGPISDDRVMEFLHYLLARHAGETSSRERHFWLTAEGSLEPAPYGLAAYLRDAFDTLPEGDPMRHAMGVLGWIGVTQQTNGTVVIRHDGRCISRLGTERLCEWLRARRDTTGLIKREVHVDGQTVEAHHDTADSAAATLERTAFIVHRPRLPWVVKRLSLDEVRHPRLKKLLRIHHEAPDEVINAAAVMGALSESGILAVDGENVVSLHVPTEYASLDPRAFEGKNVLARPDIAYGLMVWNRMHLAKREGAVFHELIGSINNEYTHYYSLALAETGRLGRVFTSTVMIDLRSLES